METIGVSASEELIERINQDLAYGDSRSAWFRDAAELRLAVDPLLDDRFGDHEPEARQDFVVEAVEEKLERES